MLIRVGPTGGAGEGGGGGGNAVYIAGHSIGQVAGASTGFDLIVMKLDGSAAGLGNSLWGYDAVGFPVVARYDGPAHGKDTTSDMMLTQNASSVTVVGTSAGVTTGNDYAVVRFNASDGSLAAATRFDLAMWAGTAVSGNEAATAMAVGGGRVFVTGSTNCKVSGGSSTVGDNDYCTVAYSESFATNDPILWPSRQIYDGGFSGSDVGQMVVLAGTPTAVYSLPGTVGVEWRQDTTS